MLVKAPPSIKPEKPLRISDLVRAFSNTLDSLLPQKAIQELCSWICTQDYLTTTFQLSDIIKGSSVTVLQVQQYKDVFINFEGQKQYHYNDLHQQGYSNGHYPMTVQCQYKPIDICYMFEPHDYAKTMNHQTSLPLGADSIQLHAPTYDPRTKDPNQH